MPAEHQQRVLTLGILAALVFRAIFITLGAVLLTAFSFMFLVFGVLLVHTAVQLFRHRDRDPTMEDNLVVSFARRHLPFTDRHDGGRLVTRIGGRRVLTPLFLVLVAIGSTDVLFALDSIPEIATGTSLVVIVSVLTITTVASVVKARRDPTARAHAGTLRDRTQREGEPGTQA